MRKGSKIMKKLLAGVLAGLMVLSLTACGGNKKPAAGGQANKAKTTTSGKLDWPKRTITMIVPWSAGGGSDLAVRTLTPYLEKDLGVKITVLNTTGANGWIAWKNLLKAKPDGYTIAQMNIPTVYSGYLDPQQKRKENLDSFMMVANEVSDWGCMVVNAKDTRFKDVKSFIEYGKTHEVLAADNGVGTNKQILTVNLNKQVKGLQLKQVHQAGWADSYSAILGGHIDVGWGSIGETLQGVKDGELRLLCVFAPKRSALLPDVPTFNELMPGLDVTSPSDRGFALPAGVDKAIYDRWVAAMNKSINDPEFIKKMNALGQALNYIGGDEYTAYAKKQEEVMKSFSDVMGWKK